MPLTLLAATLAGACSTLISEDKLPAKINAEGALRAFPPIEYSDYCTAQKAIARHNARWHAAKTGKPVAFRAPCELTPPPPAQPPAAAPAGPVKLSVLVAAGDQAAPRPGLSAAPAGARPAREATQ